jgi:hypothetical protein
MRTVFLGVIAAAMIVIAGSLGVVAWRTLHPQQTQQTFSEYLYATCLARSMAIGTPNPTTREDQIIPLDGDSVSTLAGRCLPPPRP